MGTMLGTVNTEDKAMSGEKLTAVQTARRLGYHVNHVYRLIRLGVIRAERFSDRWAIDGEEVERLRALQDVHGRIHHGKTER